MFIETLAKIMALICAGCAVAFVLSEGFGDEDNISGHTDDE